VNNPQGKEGVAAAATDQREAVVVLAAAEPQQEDDNAAAAAADGAGQTGFTTTCSRKGSVFDVILILKESYVFKATQESTNVLKNHYVLIESERKYLLCVDIWNVVMTEQRLNVDCCLAVKKTLLPKRLLKLLQMDRNLIDSFRFKHVAFSPSSRAWKCCLFELCTSL